MKKILIVDDEQISLMMVNHILSTEYQTACASSGQEAIEVYEREKPDMVLSDLRMPGMSGYELQQELEKRRGARVPFMFMTADTNSEVESKGLESGAMDFIRKPFRADVLIKRIENILKTIEKIEDLRMAAVIDPMTGLFNKAASESKIESLCRTKQGVLMMIDLDSFKLVNDIYGHAMGDKILMRFAEILQAVVRPIDIVGRVGGDEFIAFCQNLRDEIVIEKKSRFINKYILEAAHEFMGEDMNIPLGASIGCVFVPNAGTDFAGLHEKADSALYTVKQNGKHGFKFYREFLKEQKTAGSYAGNIANAVKVLAERNKTKGAFVLPFEQFRTLFQFYGRLFINYQKQQCILLFSLHEKEGTNISLDEASKQFLETLRFSLRQSDVVTQSAKGQFLVILPETPRANIHLVTERIMQNWKYADLSALCTVDIESDVTK